MWPGQHSEIETLGRAHHGSELASEHRALTPLQGEQRFSAALMAVFLAAASATEVLYITEVKSIRTVNLKTGMPTVREALQHLERELSRSREAGCIALKLIHGYGSSGTGGDIRIAAQKLLTERASRGEIRACIFGENWAKSDEEAWALIQSHPELKQDPDLGKRNRGITIVVL
jgi:hypothetical protein